MKDIGFILSLIICFGYYFLTISNSSRQKDKYYYKLFDTRIYILHVIGSILVGLFGIWRVLYFDGREFLYFGPFIYLIFLRLFNYFFLILYKRPIILATRWDSPPKGKNGIKIVDRFFFVLLSLITILGGIVVLKILQYFIEIFKAF